MRPPPKDVRDTTDEEVIGYTVTVPPVSPRAVESRAEEVADMRVQARRYGAELPTNPFSELLREVSRTAGHVHWLGMKVAEAPSDEALLDPSEQWGKWLRMYRAERAQLVRVSESAIRMGIAEREVQLAERQGELLAWVIGQVVTELDLPPDVQAQVPALVRRYALEAKALEAEAEAKEDEG